MSIEQGEIVIELDHFKNSDVLFYPIQKLLRSRIVPSRTGRRIPEQFFRFEHDAIPGLYIHLNEKKKIGRVTDPLSYPENEGKKLAIDAARRQHAAQRGSSLPKPIAPWKEIVKENLTTDEIRTWKFYMRRLVDGMTDHRDSSENYGQRVSVANLIQGRLPTEAEILQTGRVRRYRYANVPWSKPYIEALPEDGDTLDVPA